MLMIGDAAGMITPLCGNGMAMAIHSAKIATEAVHNYLNNKITMGEMQVRYGERMARPLCEAHVGWPAGAKIIWQREYFELCSESREKREASCEVFG